jgi:hypothetical protein
MAIDLGTTTQHNGRMVKTMRTVVAEIEEVAGSARSVNETRRVKAGATDFALSALPGMKQ